MRQLGWHRGMRGSTAIRPATCMPSVLTALAPAMWGWPSAPSCTITAAPARDGAQPGASWAVLHPAPHQLVSEHHDLRCLRRPVPAHSGSRRGVGQARRRAPPARDGAQPRACGLWCTLRRTQLGKRACCCPSCWPSSAVVLGSMRYARHGHTMHARRAGARQKSAAAPRTRHYPGCSVAGPTPSNARRSPRRRRDRRDATRAVANEVDVKSLRRASVRCALATTHTAPPCQHPVSRFWPAAACGGL